MRAVSVEMKIDDGEFLALSPTANGLTVSFQQLAEAKTVKNPVHLDVRIGDDDQESIVASLIERGAIELHRGQPGLHLWVTMADPEGNEF